MNNKWNIIKPSLDSSEVSHPRNSRSFEKDEEVWVQNFHLGEKWIPGSIVAVTDPVLYQVSTETGFLRKHVDHSRKRKHTDPLLKCDFLIPLQKSVDKAMKEFERIELLPVSEQSLSQKTPPSPASSDNKLVICNPNQNNHERDTLSDYNPFPKNPAQTKIFRLLCEKQIMYKD